MTLCTKSQHHKERQTGQAIDGKIFAFRQKYCYFFCAENCKSLAIVWVAMSRMNWPPSALHWRNAFAVPERIPPRQGGAFRGFVMPWCRHQRNLVNAKVLFNILQTISGSLLFRTSVFHHNLYWYRDTGAVGKNYKAVWGRQGQINFSTFFL